MSLAEEQNMKDDESRMKSILVVEDDPVDRNLMRDRLKRAVPYDVIVAYCRSFRKVYEDYRDRDFDLILLEINLPDNYGINTVKDIRKLYKNVPIVVTTSLAGDVTREECSKAGAQELLLKNRLNNEKIKEVVDHYLELQEQFA